MRNLTFTTTENDDRTYTTHKRSKRQAEKHLNAPDASPVPDRSCMTCRAWTVTDVYWGMCGDVVMIRKRVPDLDIPDGTLVARGDPVWSLANAYGEPFRTHRTFRGCSRYQEREAA